MADLYSVLGVNRTATKQQIKEAFRRQALEHHPDKHAEQSDRVQSDHAKQFRAANEAYGILGDDVAREVYNRSGRTAAGRVRASGRPSYQGSSRSSYNANYSYTYQGTYQGARATYARPRRGLWTIAQMIVARSSRGDALFHAAMLACVLGGGLVAGNAGEWIWQSSNRGKLFADVEQRAQHRRTQRQAAEDAHSAKKAADQPEQPSDQEAADAVAVPEFQEQQQQQQPEPEVTSTVPVQEHQQQPAEQPACRQAPPPQVPGMPARMSGDNYTAKHPPQQQYSSATAQEAPGLQLEAAAERVSPVQQLPVGIPQPLHQVSTSPSPGSHAVNRTADLVGASISHAEADPQAALSSPLSGVSNSRSKDS